VSKPKFGAVKRRKQSVLPNVVCQNGRWYADWRVYEVVGGVEKCVRRRKAIGSVNDFTREQAMETATKFAEKDQIAVTFDAEDPDKGRNAAIAELTIAADLMAQGYEVYRALNQQAPCDLIALRGAEIVRVECKKGDLDCTGRPRMDKIRRNMGKFDIAGVLTSRGNVVYLTHNEIFAARDGKKNTCTQLVHESPSAGETQKCK
jgi:hypothetical protein